MLSALSLLLLGSHYVDASLFPNTSHVASTGTHRSIVSYSRTSGISSSGKPQSTASILDTSTSAYAKHAHEGANALQQYYDQSTGLWNTTDWWNGANCLTTLADLAILDTSVHNMTDYVFPTTFVQAQRLNSGVAKKMRRDNLNESMVNPQGFVNGYYDDEGWWALAWIRVYDATGESQYLDAAADIFEDMKGGWSTPCGGGIWWDKAHTYVNAIANELFLSVAASLANRKENKSYYLSWAEREWEWFAQSGMLDPSFSIHDGLDMTTCKENNGAVWSYNQGVVLGGLVELAKASDNSSSKAYIKTAQSIASAAIHTLSDQNGVLREPCEPNCGGNASQFKGVFMRNLRQLYQASPNDDFAQFIEDNAISVWTADRGPGNQLGLIWAGPYDNLPNASSQSSALDALVAAVALS